MEKRLKVMQEIMDGLKQRPEVLWIFFEKQRLEAKLESLHVEVADHPEFLDSFENLVVAALRLIGLGGNYEAYDIMDTQTEITFDPRNRTFEVSFLGTDLTFKMED
jgi:hypothetical protein